MHFSSTDLHQIHGPHLALQLRHDQDTREKNLCRQRCELEQRTSVGDHSTTNTTCVLLKWYHTVRPWPIARKHHSPLSRAQATEHRLLSRAPYSILPCALLPSCPVALHLRVSRSRAKHRHVRCGCLALLWRCQQGMRQRRQTMQVLGHQLQLRFLALCTLYVGSLLLGAYRQLGPPHLQAMVVWEPTPAWVL